MSQRGRNEKAGEPAGCPICKKVVRRLGKHMSQQHPDPVGDMAEALYAAETDPLVWSRSGQDHAEGRWHEGLTESKPSWTGFDGWSITGHGW